MNDIVCFHNKLSLLNIYLYIRLETDDLQWKMSKNKQEQIPHPHRCGPTVASPLGTLLGV